MELNEILVVLHLVGVQVVERVRGQLLRRRPELNDRGAVGIDESERRPGILGRVVDHFEHAFLLFVTHKTQITD